MQSRNLLSILSTFFFLTVIVSAFSWPDLSSLDPKGKLIMRQDNNDNGDSSSSPSSSASQSAVSSSSRSASASASGSGSSTITASASRASGTASGTASNTVSGGRSGNSTLSSAIDPRLPPGGVSMMTPAPTESMTFVKVGDQVTFAWNYTSLSVPPSYVDVVATNTVNRQTYTIAANQTWNATQTVVWDTGAQATNSSVPFVVASYTLMIYDAASDPTTVPSAGYLGAFSNLVFGVYIPQQYVPLDQFHCATCNGAFSVHEKQAMSVVFATCIVTILSFTWFASGFGLF